MKNFSINFQKIAKILIAGLVALIFFIIWSTYFKTPDSNKNLILSHKLEQIVLDGKILNVEIADTDALRSQGLSSRTNLADNAGMWFVFDNDDNWGFWMIAMNFPLDIIWFDKDLKIVSIQKNISPESYPKIFYPETKSRYVLEVRAGFSEKSKIKIGDYVKILPIEPIKD